MEKRKGRGGVRRRRERGGECFEFNGELLVGDESSEREEEEVEEVEGGDTTNKYPFNCTSVIVEVRRF